ncbi:MAG TPA: DNA repair protein RadC [Nitrospirae bacterium]|nr:DNA repair protein RadC [Nitrospirota bacterium]
MKSGEKPSHHLGHRERLRKRFIEGGVKGLQDYEALELLLTYAVARKDTKPAAKALLKRFKGISGVFAADLHELKEVEGIGEKSAVLIKLMHVLMELCLKEKALRGVKLSSPDAVIEYCRVSMGWLRDEQFRVIYLNSQNQVISEEVIQEGTVDQAVVYPRKVIEYALRHKAAAFILVHNHPGGLLRPSRSDIELTKRLKGASEEMGLRVHDHLIITRDGHYSFYENGLL